MAVADRRVAGRYKLGPSLGVGGMGRVRLARDEVLKRDVAVKEIVLPLGLADDETVEIRMRTLREARAAARLNHPNVVRIYDVVPGEQQPWIVMEYVRSRSFKWPASGWPSCRRSTPATGPACCIATSSRATC